MFTNYGFPLFWYSIFLNANHIVWLNDLFSRNFIKYYYKVLQNAVNLCFQNELRYDTGYSSKLKLLVLIKKQVFGLTP